MKRWLGARSLFLFGVLLLAADTLGALMHDLGVPRIVGYILAGIALGPAVGNVVPLEVAGDMGTLKRLAIGLISLLAGPNSGCPTCASDGER